MKHASIHSYNYALRASLLFGVLSVVALVFFVAQPTSAQFDLGMQKSTDPDEIVLSPQFPSPGEIVTAKLSSPMNLVSSYTIWTLNGTVVQQSNNGLTYTFTAGDAGSKVALTATASIGTGSSISANKTITINDVTLLWEAKTYTPPLYRGRALVSPGAEATVLVVPSIYNASGAVYDPSTLIYTWRVDANAEALVIGSGVTSVTVRNDHLYKPIRVSVRIATKDGIDIANKYLDIPIVEPKILLYEDGRITGTRYAQALSGEYSLTTSEVTLIAEPYYMSASTRNDSSLLYTWQIGSLTQNNAGSIILRPEGEGDGSAKLNLIVTSANYLAQRIRGELSILFTARASAQSTNSNTTPL